MLVTESGGVAPGADAGWNYGLVASADELMRTYADMMGALLQGPVDGFCYTQLADIQQERNGLLSFDRRPKVDPSLIRPLTQQSRRR